MARDAEHRHVVKAEEVVLGLAANPGWLVVVDDRHLIAEVADQTAEIGVLLLGQPELLDDFTVI